MTRYLRFLPVVLAVTACSDRGLEPGPLTGLSRELSAVEKQLIQTDNRFALKLFQKVNAEDTAKNVFVSPLSAAMALGMTYNGAAGTTEEAMRNTLGLEGLTPQQINESYRSLIDLLGGLDPAVKFQIANSIWYRQGFSVESTFLDANRTFFNAEVAALNFNTQAAASQTVNDWVRNKTNDLIPQILTPDDFVASAVMFLVNAIYFKGSWTQKFDKSKTAPGSFTVAGGAVKSVPMMRGTAGFSVGGTGGIRVVDLPYGGGAYSMTILLPPPAETADALAARLDDELWTALTAHLAPSGVPFSMPRFKLAYGKSFNKSLQALGMGVAFTDAADFTRINRDGGLYIDEVRHKAFVDVNEEGTEAAAVTSVGVRSVSAPAPIDVDRPFIFAIREKFSGTILFLGKITDPTLSGT